MDTTALKRMTEACERVSIDPASMDCWVDVRIDMRDIAPLTGEALPPDTRLMFPAMGVVTSTPLPDYVAWTCLFIRTVSPQQFTVSASSRAHPKLQEVTYDAEYAGAPFVPLLALLCEGGLTQDDTHLVRGITQQVSALFAKLRSTTFTAYKLQGNPANAKRIRSGKKPLFTWTTVTIEPPVHRTEPKGGHHASPRLHERRGHYRTYKSGTRVWIANCKVGRAADGIGFHDYRIK